MPKVDESVEREAEKDLEMLIEIACKLTQNKEDTETKKQKEVVIDIDDIELSLDVPSVKTLDIRSKVIDVSLEDIKKVLVQKDEDKNKTIKVSDWPK